MKLNELTDPSYSRKKRMRVGRGIGSGKGKTCGAGHKGQKSRSGVSINGFEGGQMPIYRRVPKKGFVSMSRITFQKINIGDIQKLIDEKKIKASDTLTKEVMLKNGIIKANKPLKLLAKGELKASIKIEADSASASAIELVRKAGGEVVLLVKKAA